MNLGNLGFSITYKSMLNIFKNIIGVYSYSLQV